ncbi:MAG: ROK family protein [Terriglobia bacterium]
MGRRAEIIVGVDMGGTSLRAVVVNEEDKILAVEKNPTPVGKKPDALIEEIAAQVIDALEAAGLKRSDLRAVSVGAPGAVNPEKGLVYEAPNLGWKDVRLGPKLSEMLEVPVLVENDVNVGTMGEYGMGAGKGAQELVGIFVGTGIGGGIISRGELYEGLRGAAGEIGHMVLQVDGPRCGCGKRGCAEALASRTAMEREVRSAIKRGAKSCVLELMKERNKERMTSSIIVRALKKKDRVMRDVLKRTQRYLGILAANVVNLLDPECVVIGGGIAERLQDDFVDPIRKTAREYFLCQRDASRVKIVPARLGDNAGALGAVVLARRRLA